jgi:hypothetical protein
MIWSRGSTQCSIPALLRGLLPTDRAQRPVNCAAHGKLSGAPAATLIVATSALNDLLLAADNTVSRLIRGNLHYRLFCLAAWACRSGLARIIHEGLAVAL